MCNHANDAEARRCACTGYGMGDPPCRCKRGKSLHENGIGRCVIPAARCHEFVAAMCDPLIITTDHIEAAAQAIVRDIGVPATHAVARRVAAVALIAGRDSILSRDTELERVRRQRDRLRDEVTELIREQEGHERYAGRPPVGVGGHQYLGPAGSVGPGRVQPPDSGTSDHRMAGRTVGGLVVHRLRHPAPVVFPAGSPGTAQRDSSRRLSSWLRGDLYTMKGWYYGATLSVILVIGMILIAFRNGVR